MWGAACSLVLVFAVSANAASPGETTYAGVGAAQVSQITHEPSATAASTSSLPFTGMDVGLVAAVGISLVGVGFVIRRSARADKS
jgi:hypothetical protein